MNNFIINLWMIENWIENHVVSVKFDNIVNLQCPTYFKGMTNNVRFTFSGGDTTHSGL